jgi:hypothetical protein
MYRRAYGNKGSDPLTLGETSPLELFKLGSKHRFNWTGFWFKYCRKDEWFKGVSVNQESPRVHAGECQPINWRLEAYRSPEISLLAQPQTPSSLTCNFRVVTVPEIYSVPSHIGYKKNISTSPEN